MRNFDYQTPTRLIFGRDVVEGLPEVMRPFGRRILLTYGGGSIKRIGLYDRVRELLKDFEIFELVRNNRSMSFFPLGEVRYLTVRKPLPVEPSMMVKPGT